MRANNKLELAVIVSILLHLVLIGLLMLGSFFTHMIQPSAGGSGGNSDDFEAVMVDTGQVAKEFGLLQQKKQSELKQAIEQENVSEQAVIKKEVEQNESLPTPEDVQLKKVQELAERKVIEQQRIEAQKRQQQENQKKEQEIAQKALLLKKQEEETRKKLAESARLKAEAEAKRLETAAKQAEKEKKAKEEKQKQLAEQKVIEEQKKIAAQDAKLKAEKEAKAKAEKEAKENAEKVLKEKSAKAKAEKEAKLKAEKEAKAKAEKDAKEKAEKAKNNKALDDFFSNGDLSGSSKGGNKNTTGSQGAGNSKSIGDNSGTDDRGYENLIKKKLSRTYRVEDNFRGRECRIKLFLERDGRISNHQVISGPEDICRSATAAIIAAKSVPPAPNDQLYTKYKSPVMRFSLKIQ